MSAPVFLFPGQGSHYVGMGRAFHDSHAAVRELFDIASDVTGRDMRALCFEGPEATLVQTDNVQPAITLVNVACFEVLRAEGIAPAAAAGHSLGEYAALYAAGVCSFADTMRLVNTRGAAMKAAAERHPGGMIAVFGLDIDTLTAVCEEVTSSGAGSVQVANQNSPRQIALTGESAALTAASQAAKQRGAKLLVPLKVSGPWHSRFMAEAEESLRGELAQVELKVPTITVVSNMTAAPYPGDPDGARELLLGQLTRPVLWADSMRGLIAGGRSLFIEAGPGKVLTNLMKDTSREVTMFNVQDADTLQALRTARADLFH